MTDADPAVEAAPDSDTAVVVAGGEEVLEAEEEEGSEEDDLDSDKDEEEVEDDDEPTARLCRRAGEIMAQNERHEEGLALLKRALLFEPESTELFAAVDELLHHERL